MNKTHFDILVAAMADEQLAQLDNALSEEQALAYAKVLLLGWLVSGYAVNRDLTVFEEQARRIVREALALEAKLASEEAEG